jgi:hypothetical protein
MVGSGREHHVFVKRKFDAVRLCLSQVMYRMWSGEQVIFGNLSTTLAS